MRSDSTVGAFHPALANLLAGPAAALLLLAYDTTLIRLTFGTWAPATPRIVLLTLGAGATVGAAIWAAWSLAARLVKGIATPSALDISTLTFGLLYAMAAWFRFERVGLVRQIGEWAPPLLALLFWGGTCFVFQRIAAAADRGWLGVLFSGLFLGLFLVGNRELVDRPTSPDALAFDAAALLVTVLLLLLLRSRWKRRRRSGRALLIATSSLSMLLVASAATFLAQGLASRTRLAESNAAGPRAGTPHVVVFVFDTMRNDVFEDVLANTPEGRAFAEALGPVTWFDQAIAASSWTGPSMTTVFTGLHPLQHQVRGSWQNRIPLDEPILAEFLRSAGYQTLAIVANRSLARSIGTERGFQISEDLPTAEGLAALGRLGRRVLGPEEGYGRPESWFVDARRARKVLEHRLKLVDPSRPVFLWYHLMDVHQPLRDHSTLPETPGDAGLDPGDRAYRNSARFALGESAHALRAIQQRLPPEDTLTIVLSDHGEMFASDNQSAPQAGSEEVRTIKHGHTYYDSVVHVPLGIQLPIGSLDAPQRAVSRRLVSHLDIVPTVLDAADLEWPRPIQGCSLIPLVADGLDPAPEHCHPFVVSDGNIFSVPHAGLRTTRLKLLASPEDAFDPLLYDLRTDPREQVDRAEAETEATASALALLRSYWARYTTDRSTGDGELDPHQIETLRALGYL